MDLMRGLRTFPGCGRATRWQIQPEFCFLRAKGDEPDIKDQCLLSLVLQFSFCGLHPCLSVSFSPSILNNGLNRFSSGQQFSNKVMEYAGYCSQRKCHSRARNARWTHVTMTCYYYYCHYPRSVRVSCRVEAPRMENSSSSGVDSQAVVTELLDWSIAISRTIRSHCCLEVCTGNLWATHPQKVGEGRSMRFRFPAGRNLTTSCVVCFNRERGPTRRSGSHAR